MSLSPFLSQSSSDGTWLLAFINLGKGFCSLVFLPAVADSMLDCTSGLFPKGSGSLICEGSD